MAKCVPTSDARNGSPAFDTSRTQPGYNSKMVSMNNDKPTSLNLPDLPTPARSAECSETARRNLTTPLVVSEPLPTQTELIAAPHKRIKWNESGGFAGILPSDRLRWRLSFPRVNIDTELRIMHEWLLANPKKRKRNYYRFVSAWFSRCQDVGGSSGAGVKPATCSGFYQHRPLSKKQIEAATRENLRPGGNCDQISALRRELKRQLPDEGAGPS